MPVPVRSCCTPLGMRWKSRPGACTRVSLEPVDKWLATGFGAADQLGCILPQRLRCAQVLSSIPLPPSVGHDPVQLPRSRRSQWVTWLPCRMYTWEKAGVAESTHNCKQHDLMAGYTLRCRDWCSLRFRKIRLSQCCRRRYWLWHVRCSCRRPLQVGSVRGDAAQTSGLDQGAHPDIL